MPALPPDPLVQRWVAPVSVLLALAGLAVAGYLTVEHLTASQTLACPDTGALNCLKVTTSPQSVVFGVPVAGLGVGYFAAMLAASIPAVWARPWPLVRTARLAVAAAGVLFVGWLVYAELFVVNAICLYCTVVHVLAVALFAVTAIGTAYADPQQLRR